MTESAVFEVLDGGLLTTVQDAGRPDATALGVPECGAADPWAFRVANALAGNTPDAAVLELTIAGPTLRAIRPVTIALAGADLGGRVGSRRLPTGRSHRLAAGDVLELPGGSDGARAVLAVRGGFAVPRVLGSRSTCLAAGFGGLDGRPLRAGDRLAAGNDVAAPGGEHVWPDDDRGRAPGVPALRVVAGPDQGLAALLAGAWRVSSASDRVGTRLDGAALPDGIGGETTTHGVVWGAIQVPPDGRPIILGPDHQTTGGYRVIGVVIAADRPALARLVPGRELRFVETTLDAAVDALRAQRQSLADGVTCLRETSTWDALIDAAGG